VQALIRNDFSHAEEFLNEAKELLPKSHLVHNNLGVLYRETQRKDLAILHFRIATELEPRDTKVRMNLKRILAVKTLE
jgi:Flp pilus assembly protein TadD